MRALIIFITINLLVISANCQLYQELPDTSSTKTSIDSVPVQETPSSIIISKPSPDQIKYDRTILYENKIRSYSKMKRTGTTLGFAGGGLLVAGIALASTADWDSYSSYSSSGYTTNDPTGLAGILFIAAGVPLTVTGIILGSIGSRKVRYYRGLLQNVSLNLNGNTQQAGLTLTYKF